MMGENPSRFAASGGNFPVETVNWFDVQDFLERLAEISEGNRFRLPTEAEWEFACRAGTTTAFSVGSKLARSQANIAEPGEIPPKSSDQTTLVGSFPPNPWGLYDLHGNVWEWTEDDHCPYPTSDVRDPVGNCASQFKVIRGGSWLFAADSARCALRYTHQPQDDGPSLGFRVVRERKIELISRFQRFQPTVLVGMPSPNRPVEQSGQNGLHHLSESRTCALIANREEKDGQDRGSA